MTGCQGQAGPGVKYTYAQLEGLWINNGGPASAAPIAAAIALAESGGCSTALNPTDNNGTQSSFGLWQVSNGTHAPPVNNIYDANVNARQAVAKYQGGNGFSPWGTYNSGAYKAFLNGSTTPDTSVPGGSYGPAGGSTAATTSSSDATCAVHWPSANIPVIPGIYTQTLGGGCIVAKTQLRAFLGAMILVTGGLVVLPGLVIVLAYGFRASGAAAAVTQVISVIPAGRAASAGTAAAGARASRAAPGSGQARRAAGAPAQQRRAVRGQAPRQRPPKPTPRPPRAVAHEDRPRGELGELREVPEPSDNG